MTEEMDSRVGFMTVEILRDFLLDYIKAYTVDGKYAGDLDYLILYEKFDSYLKN